MITRRLAALAAVVLFVAACSAAQGSTDETADGDGGELQATRWVLRSYASGGALTIVPGDQYADADFTSQRVKGFAGCGNYDAIYRTGGRLLLVSMPVTTLASCGETTDAFQSSYLALLLDSRFYNVRGDVLTIRGADASILLVLDAAPANPLLGQWVVDSYATTPGSPIAPLAGTELTATFRLRNVAGSSGCNTYDGPYTTNGNVVAIGPLATTRMACAEDIMAQETSFLAALQGVGRIEPRGRLLLLQNLTGSTLVQLVRPSEEPSPSPSASPSASARPSRSPAPSATTSAAPSATATAAPTASPTPARTAAASRSPAPTVAPPASLPPTASCELTVPAGAGTVTIATLVYPADWNTVGAPSPQACRYFDPEPITVPADPATLTTAVIVKADLTVSYQQALASATSPAAWNVLRNEPVTVSGLPATRIEATSTAGSPGYPAGVTRYGYLIDLGGQRSAWIETSGTLGAASYVTNTSVVDLMASESTITPPIPS
jgi:heat shock protein HslJ